MITRARTPIRPSSPRVLLLALVFGMAASTGAQAQVAVAEAGPTAAMHFQNQINTYATQTNTYMQRLQEKAEFAQQAARWKATWDHYYQQISRFMSQVRNPTLSNKVAFTTVGADFGVTEKCGGSGGLSFDRSSMAQMLAPDMEGDVRMTQQRLCAQIQMLENQKHNLVVQYFQQVAPILRQDLQKIDSERRQNNTQGTVATITEASGRLANVQQQSGKELDAQLANCDTAIAMLTRMQQALAYRALKGQPNPVIGTLVKTAALKAALSVK